MPRPRTERTTRSHHKKPAPVAPELAAAMDTITDEIGMDDLDQGAKPSPTRARTQKAGPKKVLSETTRIIGDGLAAGVLLATNQPDTRKNLTMPEAQSIAHPVTRMVARRLPDWLKPFLPKTKLNPEDAADIEEILATIGKWGIRLLTVMVTDFIEGREKAQATRQQQRVMQNTNAQHEAAMQQSRALNPEWAKMAEQSARASERETVAATAQPSPNGHNPAFDVLHNVDLGFVGE